MDNSIEQLLAKEIEKTILELKNLDASSDKAKATLAKLANLQNQRKIELDALLKNKQQIEEAISKTDENTMRMEELEQRKIQFKRELEMRENELAQKEAELKEAKKSRRWKTVVDIFSVSLPIGVGLYGLKKGFEFEEEGKIYSSRTTQFVLSFMKLFSRKG